MIYVLWRPNDGVSGTGMSGPKEVGIALYGPYLIGVELASFLLMAGLVGAYHLGRGSSERREADDGRDSNDVTGCYWRRSCSRWGWPDFSLGVT